MVYLEPYEYIRNEPHSKTQNSEAHAIHIIAISAMLELQEYKKLGTLEEVRETVEKQKAKKPIIQPWSPARCPSCGEELSNNLGDGYYIHRTFLKRCTNAECAQRLDWSEEE